MIDDAVNQYKKSILSHEFKIKELEIELEKQTFYESVVYPGIIEGTKRHIAILKLEIESFKRQIPTKPNNQTPFSVYMEGECSNCRAEVSIISYDKDSQVRYCQECGQRIDWN